MSTWIKLHDNFWRNPKILEAGEDASWVYICGLCYCSANLTDGFIPTAALRMLTAKRDARSLAKILVRQGLWIETAKGWQVHDYTVHQRSKAEIEQLRSRGARRASIHRNPTLKESIRGRDGNHCRYCGKEVDWSNRRGPLGATYDHVVPDGPDTLENLVVACRGCNSRKSGRTPEQAAMPLLPIGSVFDPNRNAAQKTDLPETDTETDNPTPTPPPESAVTSMSGVLVMPEGPSYPSSPMRTIDPVQVAELRSVRQRVFSTLPDPVTRESSTPVSPLPQPSTDPKDATT